MRIVLLALLVLVMTGCGDAPEDEELLVSAAASLGGAFTVMEEVFEVANPGVDVVLNLAGSSRLRTQIMEGAPVAVFASARPADIDSVAAEGLTAGDQVVFARNRLQIAVPSGNPAGVEGLADLADPGLLVGLCAEGVPCGDLARAALDKAGVDLSIDSNEPDVRSLLTKVEVGELDSAIVYRTDLVANDFVDGVDIPDEYNVVNEYSIVALAGSGDTAAAFIEFVMSEEGQQIMDEFGFRSP